ncbi:MAG TPA: lipid-binding SYLF domain-containing protein [Steroidobacteraceae bacterium]|jgi:lipid-binding SYLF domain-containing protein|nr:lipid-binding SYLF domain-containing protein [Steroidobacteraceae bacterium]
MRQRIAFLALPLLFAAAAITSVAHADTYSDAQARVSHSVDLVDHMKQDPHLAQLLDQARGVFIIPNYHKGALLLGGQGGGGVVLIKRHGRWSDPAFYSYGGSSFGFQAGGSSGSLVMMLMTPMAVRHFEDNSGKWSLSASAGLNVAIYNVAAEGTSPARGDVIVWSDARGLYGGLAAGLTGITADRSMDEGYYHRDVTGREILSGTVRNHAANQLRDALATRVAQR